MTLRDYSWEPSYATSDIREDGKLVDVLHDTVLLEVNEYFKVILH